MKSALSRWSRSGLVLLLLLGLALVPAPADTASSSPLPVPIVFTSRNHLDTIDAVHVGPPVEILGREKAVGGKLMVLYPDGRLLNLTFGKLFDVSRPMVSFDGTRIVFSGVLPGKGGVRSPGSPWRIFEIHLDGTGFRQLTFDDRSWEIPVDPRNPAATRTSLAATGTSPPPICPMGASSSPPAGTRLSAAPAVSGRSISMR